MPLSRKDCLETKKTKIPVTQKQTATWKPAFNSSKAKDSENSVTFEVI